MKQQSVLIVEDEMIISANMEESLKPLGYRNIEVASTAEQALSNLKEKDYDVVLMDVKLNDEMDGIDVIHHVKQFKDVEVIYVTGNSDDQTVAKAKKTLPGGFITKPVTDHNLKIQLELLLYRESVFNTTGALTQNVFNTFEADLSGLTMSLFFDGTILAVSPQIRKLTGVPSYKYAGLNISKATFGNDFFQFLLEILDETLISDKRCFFGKVFSPYIGERMLSAEVNYLPGQMCELVFTDLSKVQSEKRRYKSKLHLAIASNNFGLLKDLASLKALVPHIEITALLPNETAIHEFVSEASEGVLLLDVNFYNNPGILEKLSAATQLKKVIMASPLEELELLQTINFEAYDGCISKGAAESTLIEMLHHVQRDYKYYDRTLINIMN